MLLMHVWLCLLCVFGRMYYKLPEVARRREEERKKAVSQSNRLRAELFKKVKVLRTVWTAIITMTSLYKTLRVL